VVYKTVKENILTFSQVGGYIFVGVDNIYQAIRQKRTCALYSMHIGTAAK
jgi:hypothetical protein